MLNTIRFLKKIFILKVVIRNMKTLVVCLGVSIEATIEELFHAFKSLKKSENLKTD